MSTTQRYALLTVWFVLCLALCYLLDGWVGVAAGAFAGISVGVTAYLAYMTGKKLLNDTVNGLFGRFTNLQFVPKQDETSTFSDRTVKAAELGLICNRSTVDASLVGDLQKGQRIKYMIAYASTVHIFDDHDEFYDALTSPGRHLSGWDGEEIAAWTMLQYDPRKETVDE